MRLFSFLTDSEFYIQILLQKIERKLTILMENIQDVMADKYNQFFEEAINAMINVGKYDPSYAKTIIQCDFKTDLSQYQRTSELLSVLDSSKQLMFKDQRGKIDQKMRKTNLEHVYPPCFSIPKVIDSIGDFTFYETLVNQAKYIGK